MIQQNRLKREKSLLTFPEWEMFFMIARNGVISFAVDSTPVSMPSSREIYRTRFSGKYRSI